MMVHTRISIADCVEVPEYIILCLRLKEGAALAIWLSSFQEVNCS